MCPRCLTSGAIGDEDITVRMANSVRESSAEMPRETVDQPRQRQRAAPALQLPRHRIGPASSGPCGPLRRSRKERPRNRRSAGTGRAGRPASGAVPQLRRLCRAKRPAERTAPPRPAVPFQPARHPGSSSRTSAFRRRAPHRFGPVRAMPRSIHRVRPSWSRRRCRWRPCCCRRFARFGRAGWLAGR